VAGHGFITVALGAAAVSPSSRAAPSTFTVVQRPLCCALAAYSAQKAGDSEIAHVRSLRGRSEQLLPMTSARGHRRRLVGADRVVDRVDLAVFACTPVFIGQPVGYRSGPVGVRRLSIRDRHSFWVRLRSFVVGTGEGVAAGMAIGVMPFVIRGNIIEALRILQRFPRANRAETLLADASPVGDAR